jgi:putative ABC transport system permease protein
MACVNVAHLQLVRSMERQREIAIRKALGSSRRQVMQPVILESLLVSLIGGMAGVLLAFPAVHVLVAMAPKELPRADEIHLNGWVLAFTLGLTALTALVSSMLPALRAAKVDRTEALKHDAWRGMSRHGAARFRDGLVNAEVAATFVLAMGAGLLLHTMMTLRSRDMGYQTRQLLVVDADAHRAVQQFNELFAQLAAVPGVESTWPGLWVARGELWFPMAITRRETDCLSIWVMKHRPYSALPVRDTFRPRGFRSSADAFSAHMILMGVRSWR